MRLQKPDLAGTISLVHLVAISSIIIVGAWTSTNEFAIRDPWITPILIVYGVLSFPLLLILEVIMQLKGGVRSMTDLCICLTITPINSYLVGHAIARIYRLPKKPKIQ